MAISKASQGSTRKLKDREQFFNLSVATNKAKWDALFAPGTNLLDLNARKWRAGHEIGDVLTGTRLRVTVNQGLLSWSAPGVRVKTASGAIVRNTLVKTVSASAVQTASSASDTFHGVALNDAGDGDLVYVLYQGMYLVLATDDAISPGDYYTVGTGGDAGKAVPGVSDFYTQGTVVEPITIAGVDYYVLTVSGMPMLVA